MNGRACRRYIFRSYNTSTLNATHFDEKPFDASAKQETKRLRGFEIRICISWSFSSDFVAVKGLNYSFESFLLFCVFVLLIFDKDFCCLFWFRGTFHVVVVMVVILLLLLLYRNLFLDRRECVSELVYLAL